MKYNEFPETASLTDNDVLLIQEANTLAIKKVNLSTLKQYIGVLTTPQPVNPPTGYVKWYRADETILSGNLVTAVIDKAPSKNNLIPFASNPTLITNAINGKPAINFNNAALKHNSESYAAKTIFLVFRKNTTANFTDFDGYLAYRNTQVDKGSASNENIVFAGIPGFINLCTENSTSGYIDNILQNNSNLSDYSKGSTFSAGTFHVVEAIFNNSTVGIKNVLVGANSARSGRYLQNQDIAEIIIYPNLLSTQERTNIYSYFKSYYNFSFL